MKYKDLNTLLRAEEICNEIKNGAGHIGGTDSYEAFKQGIVHESADRARDGIRSLLIDVAVYMKDDLADKVT